MFASIKMIVGMESIVISPWWLVIAGLWFVINGILHDTFVLINHKSSYDKELMRLLMDGHLLIFSGALMGISFLLTRENNIYGPILGVLCGTSMLIYCCMIFPFLKSFATMGISVMAIVTSSIALINSSI
jgi:hypothetical protein